MFSQFQTKIYEECVAMGCCELCGVRYTGVKILSDFSDLKSCLKEFELVKGESDNIATASKICIVCLGLSEDTLFERIIADDKLEDVEAYKSDFFTMNLSFPSAILIRDRSMQVYLSDIFGDLFDTKNVIKFHTAWRMCIQKRLCEKLNKQASPKFQNAPLQLLFSFNYMLDEEECKVLWKFHPKSTKTMTTFSKHLINNVLNAVPNAEFKTYIQVPPATPLMKAIFNNIQISSRSVHLSGTYNKYSRFLLQAPFHINKTVLIEFSVQNIIINAIENTLGVQKRIFFKASKNEDRTFRVLGPGRAFHVEIFGPKFDSLSKDQLNKIMLYVKRSKVMEVKNLTVGDRIDITAKLKSESICPITYKLLCIVKQTVKNIFDCINTINNISIIVIQQKTPLRLVHSRLSTNAYRKILHVKAKKVPGRYNLLELYIKAESGLYLEEFITGDLGRTRPSLGNLVGCKMDVIAIDIIDFFSDLPCASVIS